MLECRKLTDKETAPLAGPFPEPRHHLKQN